MIHLSYAAAHFARVMGSVRFPRSTLRTPLGPTIKFAYESIFAVEGLKSGAVGVLVWGYPW